MGRELPAPGLADTGTARERGADEALVIGEACEGFRGRCEEGLIGGALMRADEGS